MAKWAYKDEGQGIGIVFRMGEFVVKKWSGVWTAFHKEVLLASGGSVYSLMMLCEKLEEGQRTHELSPG